MSRQVAIVVGISHCEMKIFPLRSIPVFRVTFLQPTLGLSPIWKAHSGQRHKHSVCRATSPAPAANHPRKGTARKFPSFPSSSPKRPNQVPISSRLALRRRGALPTSLIKALIPTAAGALAVVSPHRFLEKNKHCPPNQSKCPAPPSLQPQVCQKELTQLRF